VKLDIRQNVTTVPTRPIAFVMAILSVVAVALTAWYSLAGGNPTLNHGTDETFVSVGQFDGKVRGSDPYSPRDPIERPNATGSDSDPYSPRDPVGLSQ